MKLDGTQFTHRPYKHYTGVLKQQGRVDLEADWNEQVDIQSHLGQTETKDVIGPCGAPKRGGGFKIDAAPGGRDLTISPGRIYVGGILCELEATSVPFSRTDDDEVVQVQNLVVDGRRFEEGQWVELTAEGSTGTDLVRIAEVNSAERKLTLGSDVDDSLTHLRRITTYTTQPDYAGPDLPETGSANTGLYLFYLDVWQRHISAIEDPDIREVALGGPDTATRAKTVWQVKYEKIEDPDGADCSRFGRGWTPGGTSIPPVMAARAEPAPPGDNPCDIPPGAGYRRLENQLYRVEIHDGGEPYGSRSSSVGSTTVNNISADGKQIFVQDWTLEGSSWRKGQAVELFSDADAGGQAGTLARIADVNEPDKILTLDEDVSDRTDQSGLKVRQVATFKWSRDNGSVAFSVAGFVSDEQVKVKRLGRDQVLGLHPGNWVEVLGDATELKGEPGTLARITLDGIDQSGRKVSLGENVSAHKDEKHPKVRRWDSNGTVAVEVSAGDDGWIGLEDGVQVKFGLDGTYETGDYWLIPARTAEGDVLWPRDEPTREPLFEAPHGTGHQYCALALVELDNGGWVESPQDCRPLFPHLTEIEVGGCCVRVAPGESVQQAIDTVIRAGGGCICLGTGVHRVDKPLLLRNARNLTLGGESLSSVLLMEGTDGQGGLVLENCAHVSVEGIFVVGKNVPALVDVRAEPEPSHALALRNLTMLNDTRSALERPGVTCAVRLAGVDEVLIEDCRLLAEVGVLCLNGDRLPREFGGREVRVGSSEQTIDFEDVEAGRAFRVGESFTASGVEVTARPFRTSNVETSDGFAGVRDNGRAGGTGQEIELNNINLSFDFGGPVAPELSLRFGYFGGELNIEINGDLRVARNVEEINGKTIGGVAVSVAGEGEQGTLILSGTVESFAVGGQEFFIDDVVFSRETTPTITPSGVRALQMRGVEMRYLTFGAWAVTAEDWVLERCDFRSLGLPGREMPRREVPHATSDGDVAAELARVAAHLGASSAPWGLPGDLLEDGSSTLDVQQLLRRVDETFSQEGNVATGVAVRAFLWRDCTVRATHLQGMHGLFAWWWVGGAITDSTVRASSRGIFAAWAHEARWSDNRLQVALVALAFVGSYRTRIEDNHVRAATGLTNVSLSDVAGELRGYLGEVARHYAVPSTDASAQAVLWILLEEGVRVSGLEELKQRAQAVIDATDLEGIPVMALAARALHAILTDLEGRSGQEGAVPAPVVALLLAGNDIEGRNCVSLDGFVPLGGLRVAENRLHTVTGQALKLDASPYAVNVHVSIALWRALFRQLMRTVPGLISGVRGSDEFSDELKEALVTLLEHLSALFGDWSRRSESFLEADLTVEENTIRSLYTAIESNLFELTIRDNQITLQEQPIPNRATTTIIGRLAESAALRPLAVAMREGASTDVARYSVATLGDERLLANAEIRTEVAEAATSISSSVSEPGITDAAVHLAEAVATRNMEAVRLRLPRFVEILQGTTNTHGIWLKGAGGRIIGNQVLVSADADPDSWARGGILLWTDRDSPEWLVPLHILRSVARPSSMSTSGTTGFSSRGIGGEALPLMGGTEGLIDANEIVGGAGHGISIREMILGVPEAFGARGVFDLKVRDNQVRGMAGAGIFLEEEALVVGVDIEGNHVTDCSGWTELSSLTDAKGGLVIRNAALCRVRGNRISRCGSFGVEQRPAVFGIDIESIYDLTLADNHVLQNRPHDAVRLQVVFGSAGIRNNDVLLDGATGIFAFNPPPGQTEVPGPIEAPLPKPLVDLLTLYMRLRGDVRLSIPGNEVHAVFLGNRLYQTLPGFTTPLYLFGLSHLNFTGNHISCQTGDQETIVHALIASPGEGLLGNNLLDGQVQLRVESMGRGVVSGNVSPTPIQLLNSGSVKAGFNDPDVVRFP